MSMVIRPGVQSSALDQTVYRSAGSEFRSVDERPCHLQIVHIAQVVSLLARRRTCTPQNECAARSVFVSYKIECAVAGSDRHRFHRDELHRGEKHCRLSPLHRRDRRRSRHVRPDRTVISRDIHMLDRPAANSIGLDPQCIVEDRTGNAAPAGVHSPRHRRRSHSRSSLPHVRP